MEALKTGLRHIQYVYAHPFDGFWILKREKKGNLQTAFLLLALLVVTTILRLFSTDWLFSSVSLSRFSAWLPGLGILLLVFLYCVSNWALTTLLDGNGSFSYIFMATMYSLTPVILLNLPIALLSRVLVLEEAALLQFLNAVCLLWSLFLLAVGNSSIHEYTMTKSVLTLIGTALIMVAILILAILFFNLVQQAGAWLMSIFREITFRL